MVHKGPGFIKKDPNDEPRPLLPAEAQEVFDALAAKQDEIAFCYLKEGCECRAQLMIEYMEMLSIDPGRAWAVAVARDLAVADPAAPRLLIKWRNHTAPVVAVDGVEHGVLVIDPSLSESGPMTLSEWAGTMRVRSIQVSQVPLTQAQIMDLQTARVLGGEPPLDAVVFCLERNVAPLPDIGGSGFRIAPDPPEGVSRFAHERMQELLKLQKQT